MQINWKCASVYTVIINQIVMREILFIQQGINLTLINSKPCLKITSFCSNVSDVESRVNISRSYIQVSGNHIRLVVIEWLLFNVSSAFFQLYHDENKFLFHEMMMRSTRPTRLDGFNSSLKQQSMDMPTCRPTLVWNTCRFISYFLVEGMLT